MQRHAEDPHYQDLLRTYVRCVVTGLSLDEARAMEPSGFVRKPGRYGRLYKSFLNPREWMHPNSKTREAENSKDDDDDNKTVSTEIDAQEENLTAQKDI